MRNIILSALALLPALCHAGEGPFFVTYTHQMEEPGNLEIAANSIAGQPPGGNGFFAAATEFEYGTRAWWTTEFYLDDQATSGQGGLFTGFRLENRFRVLPREHWINPVLYVEFEDTNGADKTLLEVVGNDSKDDLIQRNPVARLDKARELEAKLILSSYAKGFTIAENFIMEKNVAHEPFEFGYALGFSRPLALAARPERCNVCPENLQAGIELYGGLGTSAGLGLHDTSHYLAPTLAWTLANGVMFKLSPSFGITGDSARFLLRFGASYEIQQIGSMLRSAFHTGAAK